MAVINNQPTKDNQKKPKNKELAELLKEINDQLNVLGIGTGSVDVISKVIKGVPTICVLFKGGGAFANLAALGSKLKGIGIAGVALTLVVDVGKNLNGQGSWTKTGVDFAIGIIGVAVPEVGIIYIILDHYGVIDGAIDLVSGAIDRQPINVPYINTNILPQDHTRTIIPNYTH